VDACIIQKFTLSSLSLSFAHWHEPGSFASSTTDGVSGPILKLLFLLSFH
jgi:hypothetical protein